MGKRLTLLLLLLIGVLGLRAQGISSSDTLMPHKMRATYYSDKFVGRKTSSGEVFKQDLYTAAHKTLKLGTLLLVTNPANGKQVMVKVNDRCPKAGILDLTKKAARSIGVSSTIVTVQVLPNRFYTYWEHQDEMKELMESGDFMAFAGTLPINQSVPIPINEKNASLLMPPPPLALSDEVDERVDNQVAQPDKKPDATKKATPQKAPSKAKPESNKGANVKTESPKMDKAKDDNTKIDKPQVVQPKNPNALYNLVLTEVNFRSDAQKAIDKLPLPYQEVAEIVVGPHSPKVQVRLNLAMKAIRAEEVQQQLLTLFPKSFLIEVE